MSTSAPRLVSLDTIIDLPVWPVADLFPLLPESTGSDVRPDTITLAELADSISDNGLQQPIMLFNGFLLDGRNRRTACVLSSKVQDIPHDDYFIQVADFLGTSEEADELVLTLNVDRRDLTPGQRAFVAVGYADLYEGRHGGDRKSEDQGANFGPLIGKTSELLAQRFRVSTGYIKQARKIQKDIVDAEQAAVRAAEEATRQREAAEQAKQEAAVALEIGDQSRVVDAAARVNHAVQAVVQAEERAVDQVRAASQQKAAVKRVTEGKQSMGSLVKQSPGQSSYGDDPVKKLVLDMNNGFGKFLDAATDLLKCGDRVILANIVDKVARINATLGDIDVEDDMMSTVDVRNHWASVEERNRGDF